MGKGLCLMLFGVRRGFSVLGKMGWLVCGIMTRMRTRLRLSLQLANQQDIDKIDRILHRDLNNALLL